MTSYSVEQCQGASCSSFAVVGSPTGTTFANTTLPPPPATATAFAPTTPRGTLASTRRRPAQPTNSCTTNSQCGTGFCASGVCCNTACTGSCSACNLAGSVGTCTPRASGTTCRAASGSCDVAEACDGTSLTCPTDVTATEGASCDDGNLCTTTDHCVAGTCTGTPLACPGEYCLAAGTCNPTTGLCEGSSPVHEGLSCDDGNRCTLTSTCIGGSCVPEDPATGCTSGAYYVPVVNLGSTEGGSYAADINNGGEVIGVDARASYITQGSIGARRATGFRWTPSEGRKPMPRPANMAVYPRAISDTGVVAGAFYDFAAGINRGFRQTAPADTQLTVQVPFGYATDINNHDVSTGVAIFDAIGYQMFRAGPTGVQVLPIGAGNVVTEPHVIDDDGNLVGVAIRADRTVAAIRYTDALGMQLLNQLVPAGSDWNLDPIAGGDDLVNGSGTNGTQIVGRGLTGNGVTRGFVMTPGTAGVPGSAVMTKIGMLSKFPDDGNRMVSPRPSITRARWLVPSPTPRASPSSTPSSGWRAPAPSTSTTSSIPPPDGLSRRLRDQ